MIIQQIKELGKGRIIITLDDGSAFPVYRREVPQLNLCEGAEITEQQLLSIRREILIPRARKRAMYLLEKMDRTESQLREKLRQSYYPEDIVEEAVAYVKSFHYVDDVRYAESYVRYRRESRSRRQLELELARKGISEEDAEQAMLSEYGEEDECAKIARWLEKKHYDCGTTDLKQKRRMYQFLMRKGFRSEDVLKMLDKSQNKV